VSWSIVQQVIASQLGGGMTLTLPDDVTPGNKLIGFMLSGIQGSLSPAATGYQSIDRLTFENDLGRQIHGAWRDVQIGDSGTIVWGGLGGSSRPVGILLEVAGLAAGAPSDIETVTNSVGSSLSLGAVDVPADALVIGCFGHDAGTGFANAAYTPGPGVTEMVDRPLHASGNAGHLFVGRRTATTADGSFVFGATAAASDNWSGMVAVFDVGAGPAPEPKITFTVNEVELEGLVEKSIRVELNGPGSGFFVIPRGHEQATAENLARGNLVKVTIPEIHSEPIFEFFIEEGDFRLLDASAEGGGQLLRFGGPGSLVYLRRAVIAPEEYLPDGIGEWKPNRGVVVFGENQTEGHILNKLVKEAQAAGRPQDPIPELTDDFDGTNDSNGDPWADSGREGKLRVRFLKNLYDVAMRLVRIGLLQIEMAPGLVLHAYREVGTDRTSATFASGKVRFVEGVNIASELSRGMAGRDFASHAYVHYTPESGGNGWTNTAKSGSFPYVQEIGFDASDTDTAATARRAARGEMGWREGSQEALILAHTVPYPGTATDELNGLYLPGPSWSDNGLYWVGDLVTVATEGDEFGYDNATHRVYAITLREDATGYLAPPIVELNAPYLAADASSSGLTASPIAGSVTGGTGGSVVEITPFTEGFELTTEGGQGPISDHGAAGATEDADPSDGNVHVLELDDDLTVTILEPEGDGDATLQFWFTQDGTGGHTVTIDADGGTVTGDISGHTTTAGETFRVIAQRIPGTTNDWVVDLVGGGSGVSFDDGADPEPVGLVADPGDDIYAARRDHVHDITEDAVKETGRWEPVTNGDVGSPELVFEAGDIVMEWVPG
jgi:hypothetical protein